MSAPADPAKHAEVLREHLSAAEEALRKAAELLKRASHHLHNAASQASVLPRCEDLSALLNTRAQNHLTRVIEVVEYCRSATVAG